MKVNHPLTLHEYLRAKIRNQQWDYIGYGLLTLESVCVVRMNRGNWSCDQLTVRF